MSRESSNTEAATDDETTGNAAGSFCTECEEFTDHSTPVNTSHSSTGESGCPECLTATLKYVVEEIGAERTITGGYIPRGSRNTGGSITLAEARERAEGAEVLKRDGLLIADGGEDLTTECASGSAGCEGISGLAFGELPCFECWMLASEELIELFRGAGEATELELVTDGGRSYEEVAEELEGGDVVRYSFEDPESGERKGCTGTVAKANRGGIRILPESGRVLHVIKTGWNIQKTNIDGGSLRGRYKIGTNAEIEATGEEAGIEYEQHYGWKHVEA